MSGQIKCEFCGWVNQAGQDVCSWCHSPLPAAPPDESAGGAPVIPPEQPQREVFAEQAAPPGYYRGVDGQIYPVYQPPAPRKKGLSPCAIAAIAIAIGVLVVPVLIIAALFALCLSSAQGTSADMNSAVTRTVLYVVGAITVVLLTIFITRSVIGRQAD